MPASYQFHLLPLSSISEDERARKAYEGIEDLAKSIETYGLLHPIVVTRAGRIVAGGRRFRAFQHLGRAEVPVHFIDELDPLEARRLELEENIRRKDMTWQEEATAIFHYHLLASEDNPEWRIEDTQSAVNLPFYAVRSRIEVGRELAKGNVAVADCTTISAAYNLLERMVKRKLDDELATFGEIATEIEEEESFEQHTEHRPLAMRPAARDIHVEDFFNFCETFKGRRFNVLHCDFPFGVGMHSSAQGNAQAFESYSDDPEVYFALLKELCSSLDKVLLPSAHLIFWYSMKFHQATVDALSAAGLVIQDHPLIWVKSDNTGIVPDANRAPRRIYETALLCTRGDRFIVRPVSNAFVYPAGKSASIHQSAKLYPVVLHFLSMLVDKDSTFLDPTCGSGTAVCAADALGASRVIGLDINSTYVQLARDELNRRRHERASGTLNPD